MSDDRASDRELEEGDRRFLLRCRIGIARVANLASVSPRSEASHRLIPGQEVPHSMVGHRFTSRVGNAIFHAKLRSLRPF